ncbi:hypothetical protein NBRC116601_27910 [Cognatishimia sp. WU-CL00825]|uniref:hypothetical protein n=1 Tax=Cognatishimia sp. WU-CL00825 TaxID=3127658 RepID=UPI0031053056
MAQADDSIDHPEVDLSPDERLVATYQPKLGLFLQRTLWVAFLTAIAFLGIPQLGFGLLLALVGGLIAALFYAFVFGDFEEWRQRRRDRWILTNQRLWFQNPDEDSGQAWINLTDVVRCRRWMWWALRLTTKDGRVTVLRYVGPVRTIQAKLKLAVAEAKGDLNV